MKTLKLRVGRMQGKKNNKIMIESYLSEWDVF